MFDSSRPPLLVQPVSKNHITLFPTHEGYEIHPISDTQALVGYKRGWVFPLSVQMQSLVTEEPLILVRDKGGVTTTSSTGVRGYAHQFCDLEGNPPVVQMQLNPFPERPSEQWMLIGKSVVAVWLQHRGKTQYLGEHDMEHHDKIKLLIRDFVICHAYAPRLDKTSDTVFDSQKQYRVESNTLFDDAFDETMGNPTKRLEEDLIANGLKHFLPAVTIALHRAMGKTPKL